MDDYDFSWGTSDYSDNYSDDYGNFGSDDTWNASDPYANADWTGYDDGSSVSDGTTTGGGTGGSGGSIDWTRFLLQAGAGFGQGMLAGKMSKEQMLMAEKLAEQKYAFEKAEDEKYYQAHGKQLSDAYGKYKQYYTKPTAHGPNNPTSLFGLLAPKTPATQAVNGYAFDPEGAYPNTDGGRGVLGVNPYGY